MAARVTNVGTRRSSAQNTYKRTRRNTTSGGYVYGTAVRRLEEPARLEEPRKQLSPEVQVNRAKAKHMNLGYVLFLVAALSAAAVILIGYIRLQADITNMNKYITKQEKILNNMRISNDEMLSRIDSRLDLEEVRRVAIGELGMTYPEEGQIISYQSVENDYVRRVDDTN